MRILGVVASSSREVPNAPTIGTATDVGTGRAFNNGAATVTFTAPTWTGGLPITSYTVTSSPGGFTGTGTSSPITVTGLQSNTNYTFTVRATNSVGQSAASAASNSILATTIPQAPTIGTATATGATTATVAYTANATGGKTVTYTATSTPGSLTGTGASPITVSGLTSGTAYTFTVTATNANGSATSAASNSVTPVVPASYESIATFTPNGVSTVTFSSIPQTYKNLQLRIWAKSSDVNYGITDLGIRFNGDTGGNYRNAFIRFFNSDATVSTNGDGITTYIRNKASGGSFSGLTNFWGASIADVVDYTSTSKSKTVLWFGGVDNNYPNLQIDNGVINDTISNWDNTSAINSITVFIAQPNFANGTSIALYGIRG